MRQNLEIVKKESVLGVSWQSREDRFKKISETNFDQKEKFCFPTELFEGALVIYLILFVLENIIPGIVSREFPLNFLLIPVLFFGIASILFPKTEIKKIETEFKWQGLWWPMVFSIIGGILIYAKIDLSSPLRPAISAMAGILIFSISFLSVVPEGYRLPITIIENKYFWSLGLLPILLVIFTIISNNNNNITAVRLPSEQYQVLIINRSSKAEYGQSYRKLLIDNGYTHTFVDNGQNYPETSSAATVMYNEKDNVAGNEVAELISLSYPEVQKSPLVGAKEQEIIIILK